ncbi:hypothetical protein [Roseibium polysiphoniae]|uniref:hypothetical protein n=1 Tax=Roseibium polysiphoniae TaxID=2571221 RepID=UPI001BD17509|nr:hypothetical protein [Roseibium polysiphoniae]
MSDLFSLDQDGFFDQVRIAALVICLVAPTVALALLTLAKGKARNSHRYGRRTFGDFPPVETKKSANLPEPCVPSALPTVAERATLAVTFAIAFGHGLFLLYPEGLS